MNRTRTLLVSFVALLVSATAVGECIPMEQAASKLGEIACVRGKVLKASEGEKGVRFLNFCEEHATCPFTVVMFPNNLRDVGDFRLLEGQTIEINGKVKQYGSQIEMILRDRKQLRGEYAKLPNLPKEFETDRHGSYSAGSFSSPKRATSKSTRTKKPQELDRATEEDQ